ncbi:lyase family protein [Bradyrhizobium sp. Arg816]|uniref:lyase family protein n=1 Tax=Bradyrhizobium sp. Arg816 TaxID=2998491 RepID=UPI00249EA404|nr:lyase family protein [Bradyrhizobium sp. Arg816]MDI3567591.1 lyase family protein [Bradyrhizobium sp. Arg816]
MGKTRRELDSLGEVDVSSEAGAQTARATRNFPISRIPISHFSQLVGARAIVNEAAALANVRLGDLSPSKSNAIAAACDDIVAGQLTAEFAIDIFQGGTGTSTNTNRFS